MFSFVSLVLQGTYYRTIDRVTYDRALLEQAETFAAQGGNISYEEAVGCNLL